MHQLQKIISKSKFKSQRKAMLIKQLKIKTKLILFKEDMIRKYRTNRLNPRKLTRIDNQ